MQSSLRYCWSYLNCPKSVFKFCQVWLQKVFCSPRLVSRPPCSLINGSRTEMERQMHNAVHMLHTTMQCNGYHNARCNAMQTTIHTAIQCTPQYHNAYRANTLSFPRCTLQCIAHHNTHHNAHHNGTMHNAPPFPPFPSRTHAPPHPGPSLPPSSCLITFTFFSVHCPAKGHVC